MFNMTYTHDLPIISANDNVIDVQIKVSYYSVQLLDLLNLITSIAHFC